jgi:hypothetical protein
LAILKIGHKLAYSTGHHSGGFFVGTKQAGLAANCITRRFANS